MHNRTAGVILICVSAFLYGVRYLSAAIFGSNAPIYDDQFFEQLLSSVGNGPIILSWISLIVGLMYLFAADAAKLFKNIGKDIKKTWNEDFD